MKLGFSVQDLLPQARGGGALKIALTALSEEEWLQPEPDLSARNTTFDAHPESVRLLPEPVAVLPAVFG